MSRTREKRQAPRTPLRTRGIARLDDQWVSIAIKDYSTVGSRLEVPAGFAPRVGEALRLFLFGPGLGARGSVRWVAPNDHDTAFVGVRFDEADYSTRLLEESGA